jgi:hypothetical protein
MMDRVYSVMKRNMFFGCCVARAFWEEIFDIGGKAVGADFESVAKWWMCDKKCKVLNVVTSAAL